MTDRVGPATKSGNVLLQQRLKAWRPFLSPAWVITCFAVLGIAFIGAGVVILFVNDSLVEVTKGYSSEGSWINGSGSSRYRQSDIDTVTLSITANMTAPIYVYYRLTNFYQNHRRYIKSSDSSQLLGSKTSTSASDYSTCDPWIANAQGSIYYPCGLVARSVFNDTYTLFVNRSGTVRTLQVDESAEVAAWATDVQFKFGNLNPTAVNSGSTLNEDALDMWVNHYFPPKICRPKVYSAAIQPVYVKTVEVTGKGFRKAVCSNYTSGAPTCSFSLDPLGATDFDCAADTAYEVVTNPAGWGVQNGHFIAWMRTAGLPTFDKLYAKIDENLIVGDEVVVSVTSSFPVRSFEGTKTIVLSTVSILGSANNFLAVAYFVVGSVAIFFALVFGWAHWRHPRSLDAVRYLD